MGKLITVPTGTRLLAGAVTVNAQDPKTTVPVDDVAPVPGEGKRGGRVKRQRHWSGTCIEDRATGKSNGLALQDSNRAGGRQEPGHC